MDLGITGKRALVTGASSGIGRACASELAKEGVRVCATGRDETRLAEVVAAMTKQSNEAFSVSADLSHEDGRRKAMDAVTARWGGIDILINCAGAAPRSHVLHNLTPEMITEALELKLYSYLRLSQLAFPHMQSQRWGRIVHVAGAAATSPTPGNLVAGFNNAAILNLTRALSDIGARDGILVNTICPGLTDTPRSRRTRIEEAAKEGRTLTDEEVEAELAREAQRLPAGRACQPEEVARVACFLASDACSFVHASAVYMDGGARRSTP